MGNIILVICLALLNILAVVIVAAQKMTIYELRHENNELKRWYNKQHQTFWDNH